MAAGVPVTIAYGASGPGSQAAGTAGRSATRGSGEPRPRRGHDQLRGRRPADDGPADRWRVHQVPLQVSRRVRLPGGGSRRAVHRGGPARVARRRAGQPGRLAFGPGVVVVEAQAEGRARAVETVPAEFEGDEPVISFNPHYLLDGLNAAAIDAPARSAEAPADGESPRQPGGRIRIEFHQPGQAGAHHLGRPARCQRPVSRMPARARPAGRTRARWRASRMPARARPGQEDRARWRASRMPARARSARRTRAGSGRGRMPVRGTSPRSATLWSRSGSGPGVTQLALRRLFAGPAALFASTARRPGGAAPGPPLSRATPARRHGSQERPRPNRRRSRPRRSPATSRMMASLPGSGNSRSDGSQAKTSNQTIATMTSNREEPRPVRPVARDRIPIAAQPPAHAACGNGDGAAACGRSWVSWLSSRSVVAASAALRRSLTRPGSVGPAGSSRAAAQRSRRVRRRRRAGPVLTHLFPLCPAKLADADSKTIYLDLINSKPMAGNQADHFRFRQAAPCVAALHLLGRDSGRSGHQWIPRKSS